MFIQRCDIQENHDTPISLQNKFLSRVFVLLFYEHVKIFC